MATQSPDRENLATPRIVDLFHVGPPKSGTTWLYRALREHPQIVTSPQDSIHFFNINFHRGFEWYEKHFDPSSEAIVFDPTPSYLADASSPQRIFDYNPKAKIMLTARNPIERAFSHYWHEKKKDRFNFAFDEALTNQDLYTNWIAPGLYSLHIEKYLSFFPRDQIKVLFFDDLESDPLKFYQEACLFAGIDSSQTPSVMNKKVNKAGAFKSQRQRRLETSTAKIPPLKFLFRGLNFLFSEKRIEKVADVDDATIHEMKMLFANDISRLEQFTGRNLNHWKSFEPKER
ncbi:MAG: sulfotransferase domain-containing protein [Verrucomicrobiota bacterium]